MFLDFLKLFLCLSIAFGRSLAVCPDFLYWSLIGISTPDSGSVYRLGPQCTITCAVMVSPDPYHIMHVCIDTALYCRQTLTIQLQA